MGYQASIENASAANAVTAAVANTIEENKTYLVASQVGATTILDGDCMSWDLTSYGGAVRTNVIKKSATATDFVRGVALIPAGSLVIPATTAAGDRFVSVTVLRRGVKLNCSVSAGAAGNVAIPGAAGVGVGAAVGTSPVSYGLVLAAPAANVGPLFVNAQF